MDNKQIRIFKKILENNDLDKPKVFMQHRNLKEFRSFFIERINPDHRIFIYGRLKRKEVHDGCNNKIIKVGELLYCTGLALFVNNEFFTFAVNAVICMFLLDFWYWRFIDVNWNRGKCWNRKNALSCPLSA